MSFFSVLPGDVHGVIEKYMKPHYSHIEMSVSDYHVYMNKKHGELSDIVKSQDGPLPQQVGEVGATGSTAPQDCMISLLTITFNETETQLSFYYSINKLNTRTIQLRHFLDEIDKQRSAMMLLCDWNSFYWIAHKKELLVLNIGYKASNQDAVEIINWLREISSSI